MPSPTPGKRTPVERQPLDIDPKIKAATGSGSAAIVFLFILSVAFPELDIPGLVQAAIATLFAIGGGYLKKGELPL